jgi:hypothetical protein
MIRERPCGACRALVPVDSGCAHWRPGAARPPRKRVSTRGGGTAETVAEFQRVMGVRRGES